MFCRNSRWSREWLRIGWIHLRFLKWNQMNVGYHSDRRFWFIFVLELKYLTIFRAVNHYICLNIMRLFTHTFPDVRTIEHRLAIRHIDNDFIGRITTMLVCLLIQAKCLQCSRKSILFVSVAQYARRTIRIPAPLYDRRTQVRTGKPILLWFLLFSLDDTSSVVSHIAVSFGRH